MGVVKKVTIFSLLIASVFGVVAKINQKRKLSKKAAKKNIMSMLFKLMGNVFNIASYKMKKESNKGWKKAFMLG